MKLSRLDACKDRKVVHWCRMQASSHDSQGIVDGVINKASMSTAAPNRSAVFCRQFAGSLLVNCHFMFENTRPELVKNLMQIMHYLNFCVQVVVLVAYISSLILTF